ncbi:hypothetical protein KDK88_01535 [bacterium]|nr:hypothetical protein [bacterium]
MSGPPPPLLLVIHAAATWAMVGLIWTVQVVHYPLLAGLDRGGFRTWQQRHMTRITWIVGPLMLVEAGAAAALVVTSPSPATWFGAHLLVLIWLSTAVLQAPLHGRLAREGFQADLHRRLVRTNWIRTAGWTLRGIVAAELLLRCSAAA